MTLFGDADNASMNVFADSHGIEHPIVLDNGWSTTARYTDFNMAREANAPIQVATVFNLAESNR